MDIIASVLVFGYFYRSAREIRRPPVRWAFVGLGSYLVGVIAAMVVLRLFVLPYVFSRLVNDNARSWVAVGVFAGIGMIGLATGLVTARVAYRRLVSKVRCQSCKSRLPLPAHGESGVLCPRCSRWNSLTE